VFGVYCLISVVATWPLPIRLASTIAADPGDPLLNASILLWSATTLPFSSRWWNAPHYYPAGGITTFTENLLGVSPLSSPVFWLTGNPLLAYNVALLLTWPLSAFAAYLLVRVIARREDAAFLAGLSFGFSPYRVLALGHIQTAATFGIPLALAALHRYLDRPRPMWLVLFGAAWLQQSLANGYYILYGGLIVAMWLAYFCASPARWKPAPSIVAAWALASIPLVPLLVKYRQVHDHFGLRRTLNEITYFSALPGSWFEVSSEVWLWGKWLPEGKDNLFPGLTAIVMVLAGVWVLLRRPLPTIGTLLQAAPRRWLFIVLGAAAALSLAAVLVGLRFGSIDLTPAGIPFKMRNLNRALAVLLLAGVPLIAITPRTREALARRSPLVFYVAATIVVAILCFGPVVRVGDEAILSPAPYGWLMALPGFGELRVPTQIKMIAILCLAVAAGLAYARLDRLRPRIRTTVFSVAAAGLLLDGWFLGARTADAPAFWPEVEAAGRSEPILELPIGPDWDFTATFRAAAHRRRVLNGVSGYDPPHYHALVTGLQARDPAMLAAIASLGPFDIVVTRAADPDGALQRYAASAQGAVLTADDGAHVLYRIPAAPRQPDMGPVLPIARVEAVRHPADWALTHDGRADTGWGDHPQKPDGWIVIDLGGVHEVGGLTHDLGEHFLDFPRRLAIDVSSDRAQWERVWEGPTASHTFLAFVREPRNGSLRFTFDARPARFVRLRQLESHPRVWRVSELQVHAPSRQRQESACGCAQRGFSAPPGRFAVWRLRGLRQGGLRYTQLEAAPASPRLPLGFPLDSSGTPSIKWTRVARRPPDIFEDAHDSLDREKPAPARPAPPGAARRSHTHRGDDTRRCARRQALRRHGRLREAVGPDLLCDRSAQQRQPDRGRHRQGPEERGRQGRVLVGLLSD
jgi:hypothetical protein